MTQNDTIDRELMRSQTFATEVVSELLGPDSPFSSYEQLAGPHGDQGLPGPSPATMVSLRKASQGEIVKGRPRPALFKSLNVVLAIARGLPEDTTGLSEEMWRRADGKSKQAVLMASVNAKRETKAAEASSEAELIRENERLRAENQRLRRIISGVQALVEKEG